VVLLSFCLEFRVFKIAETRVLPIAQILTLDNWIHFVQFFCAPCRGNGPGPESGSGEVLRPVHPYLLLARVDRKFRDKKVLGLIGRHQQAGILSGGVMPPRWRGRRQGDVIAPVAQYPVGRPGPGTGQAQPLLLPSRRRLQFLRACPASCYVFPMVYCLALRIERQSMKNFFAQVIAKTQ